MEGNVREVVRFVVNPVEISIFSGKVVFLCAIIDVVIGSSC